MPEQIVTTDGRRARRERNRVAVVDAVFELINERHSPPGVEEIAVRAGVSVSSVFRYFENLDDLLEQTVARYFERFSALFTVPPAPGGTLDDRIAALVSARLDLYEAIGPIARIARLRATEQPRLAAVLADTRRTFEGQVRSHFAPDLAGRARDDVDDRVALVDCLTAFESWDLLTGTHGRSRTLVARAWVTGLRDLLAAA
ncbi:MAG TPA: TetR/AcrR family transcriptional regulator [Acidimicrobiales bacterium]|nr:TetR/AcrR family transcriptional regulator [Acidimicrobiales bacterium]